VEFALVVPVLLALLIGIMEFGWLVRNNYLLANASREGARHASLGKTTAEVQERVRSAGSAMGVTNTHIVLTYDATGSNQWVAWPADSGTKNGVPVDSTLRVTIRIAHRPLTGFFPFLRSRNIEQFTVMRREL
jgi:Flp pilus assembly protein TadG